MRHASLVGLGLLLGVAAAGACSGDDKATTPDASAPGDASVPDTAVAETSPVDTGPVPSPFGLDHRPSNTTCVAPPRPPAKGVARFLPVFPTVTLTYPMALAQIPGDRSRMFVAQLGGSIVSFSTTSPPNGAPTTVITVPNVNRTGEGGLLGFAFHPKFSQNGQIFFSYTKLDANVPGSQMVSVIARMESHDGGATFGNYTEIVAFNQGPFNTHKGGSIAFGPDGYLYFGFGDGGGGGDPGWHGQSTDTYLAKIHRIDVDTPPPPGKTYVVPPGNPFANGGGQPSTYAWGLRNPFRFSFDRASGDLWVGDVGENLWEEIDRIRAPGANLGWSCLEAAHDYASSDPGRCPNPKAAFLAPVFEYPHNGAAASVIGGVVYRGSAVPDLVGTYVFGDWSRQIIMALEFDPQTGVPKTAPLDAPTGTDWVDFAEDNDGELYVVESFAGKIYEMAPALADAGIAGSPFPDALSKTGCVDAKDPTRPAPGLIPYSVNSPLWSDGAGKERWLAVPDGQTIAVGADGHLDLPIGSVLVKTFALGATRVETRLLVRHADGGWAGYSYEWNDAQTDAVLLPGNKSKAVGAASWYYPSRSECFACHSGAAQRTLGMELAQLNGDGVYPTTNRIANQLATLDHVGLFTPPLGVPASQLPAYPAPAGAGPLEARARSFLHANCSMCHQPGGSAPTAMDLRFATALGDTKACGVAPNSGDLGVAGALLIAPGAPTKSLISLRAHTLDATRMPPLASRVVDVGDLAVVDAWITGLASCPAAVGDAGADADAGD